MGEKQLPTDILSVLDLYKVDYTMSGNIAMVHCLFHPHDNTPSMAVYPDTNSFFCFACQQSGTTETLVMKLEGCTYTEAVKLMYGNGYEWRKLKTENKSIAVDDKYLYNILSRNLRKEFQKYKGNEEELLRLKQLVAKYLYTQVKPKELFSVLREIKKN